MEERQNPLKPWLKQKLLKCVECEGEGWRNTQYKYNSCPECMQKPGHELIDNGRIYVKLTLDSPYYSMTVKALGYWGSGWVNKARLVMAEHLGRVLESDELVYRKDGDSINLSLDNLRLVKKTKQSEESTRKTRNYKFGYDEGYESGYESGYKDALKELKQTPKLNAPTIDNEKPWADSNWRP